MKLDLFPVSRELGNNALRVPPRAAALSLVILVQSCTSSPDNDAFNMSATHVPKSSADAQATPPAAARKSATTLDAGSGIKQAISGGAGGVPARATPATQGRSGGAGANGAAPQSGAGTGAAGVAANDGGRAGAATDAGGSGSTSVWPPFEAHGEPLPARPGRWTDFDFPDAVCRDGSTAGISLNLGTSKKLMIFLEGGGECDDTQTCQSNPANRNSPVAAAQWSLAQSGAGVFARTNMENPVRDWNYVYVHYCSGDRYGGANPDGNVPGVGPQKFVGYLNMEKFLDRLVPTFSDVTDVLVTGVSAGGYGSARVLLLVQRAFSRVKVRLIDDSGPPVSKALLDPCMQERWRTQFKVDQTFLKDCGSSCPDQTDYWQDYFVFLAETLSDRPLGVIESTQDSVERSYFGLTGNNCMGRTVSGAELRADLLSFRERVKPYPNFGTFFPDSTTHTWIMQNTFYTTSAGGVRLVDWFAKIVNGEPPGHGGP